MLIDANYRIVHMSETAGRYVMPSAGQLRNDVTELVRPELRFDLRAALHLAFERNQPSIGLAIPVRFNGSPHQVFLQVRPVPSGEGSRREAIVFFIEGDALEEPEGRQYPGGARSSSRDLSTAAEGGTEADSLPA